MYTSAKREHEGVFPYPDTEHLKVWGFTGVDAIVNEIPGLKNKAIERPLLNAIKRLGEYMDLVFVNGAILDSRGMERNLRRELPDDLMKMMEAQGIVYMTGSTASKDYGIRRTEINTGSSNYAYFVRPNLQEVLKYDPAERQVTLIAKEAYHAPQLDSFINVLAERGNAIFQAHEPSLAVLSPRTVIRQGIYDRAVVATASRKANV